jgi:hypothetical protein
VPSTNAITSEPSARATVVVMVSPMRPDP